MAYTGMIDQTSPVRNVAQSTKQITDMDSLIQRSQAPGKHAADIAQRFSAALDRIQGPCPIDVGAEAKPAISGTHISTLRDNMEQISRDLDFLSSCVNRLESIG